MPDRPPRLGAAPLPTPPRTVFMGTPAFAVPSLKALIEAGVRPVAVVTTPDGTAGRGKALQPSAVKAAALDAGLPVLQPAGLRDPDFVEALAALAPEIIVVVAFRILPPEVYGLASLGAFNLHSSLLPAFRGAAPIQRAIMEGVAETGVTTFFLRPSVDTGAVILQRATPVGPDETAGELHDRLAALGAEAVVETVRLLAEGRAPSVPQDDALASAAPKIFRDDARLDWARPAPAVHNHVRALAPAPGAWTLLEGETLKVLRTRLLPEGDALSEASAQASGTILEAEGRLVVACGEGAVEVLEVQREGKKRMEAPAFLRGAALAPGTRLGP